MSKPLIKNDPPAEVKIDLPLVRNLIHSQFPEFEGLPIKFVDAGWDNENYLLGEDYLIRIPRRALAAQLLENESAWLPKIKDYLSIAIPAPIKIGEPTSFYPWSWSILPWYSGKTANQQHVRKDEAIRLAEFLKILHGCNAQNAPENLNRGVHLNKKDNHIQERIKRLADKTDLITPRIVSLWNEALNVPFPKEAKLIHGDLHPRNIIVEDNQIKAIIDWGDITSGDVASDMACFWMLFDDIQTRSKAFSYYGASYELIQRSRGWAIFYGITLLDTGLVSNQAHAKIGEFTLQNIHAETL